MENRKRGWVSLPMALLLAGIFLIGIGLTVLLLPYLIPSQNLSLGTVDGSILMEIPLEELDDSDLYITSDRRAYDGTMTLIIPSIGVETRVGISTSPEGLRVMPGLYEFAQMPDEDGGNVSIAGHRDIYDEVFYYLDGVKPGDYLYLIYQENIYRYLYKGTKIVPPTDWEIIRRQGYTALTLTTCDPIGTTRNRLVVTGELQFADKLREGIVLPANETQAG